VEEGVKGGSLNLVISLIKGSLILSLSRRSSKLTCSGRYASSDCLEFRNPTKKKTA
ncbi:14737_t:CDS:2, partial [Rhizophagus irregularis]